MSAAAAASGAFPAGLPDGHRLDARLAMDGMTLLAAMPDGCLPAAFFDPQYRGVLDRLGYGNEGVGRQAGRCALPQMSDADVADMIAELGRVLAPSGHLFLWLDKFHLCSGFGAWLEGARLEQVDLILWHKQKLGMGHRSRNSSEPLLVLQQPPLRAKGVWRRKDIPDVWSEPVPAAGHPHRKPVRLQAALIEAVTRPGDVIVDPAAGGFSVLEACRLTGRRFLGCDLLANGPSRDVRTGGGPAQLTLSGIDAGGWVVPPPPATAVSRNAA